MSKACAYIRPVGISEYKTDEGWSTTPFDGYKSSDRDLSTYAFAGTKGGHKNYEYWIRYNSDNYNFATDYYFAGQSAEHVNFFQLFDDSSKYVFNVNIPNGIVTEFKPCIKDGYNSTAWGGGNAPKVCYKYWVLDSGEQ
jgi:hypothetical protein